MHLYVQEPRLSPLDIKFLESIGFTILNDHAALGKIHPFTFLMITCLEWQIETPYRENAAACSLYLSSRMDWVIDEARRWLNNPNARDYPSLGAQRAIESAKVIKKRHHAYEFPEFVHSDALAMTIYTMKSTWEEEDQHEATQADYAKEGTATEP